MAATLITAEEYLSTIYKPDTEYVDGVIEERPMGEGKHSAWQMTIGAFFFVRSREWHTRVRPELRTQTGAHRYWVLGLAIIASEAADCNYPAPRCSRNPQSRRPHCPASHPLRGF